MTNRAPATLLLALLAACAADRKAPPPARPNILFVYTDDHATAALSAYDARRHATPSLDRLAAEGALFENAFCTNGICAPARAVVLTGLHSHLNGVTDNGKVFDGSQATFPKLLQGAGYQTALIGKWHLKSDPTGFDHWEILPGQGQYYAPDFRTAAGPTRYPGYVTEVTTDLALEWLAEERDPEKPFLLMVQHKAPHRSWMPAPAHLDTYADEQIFEPATLFDDGATRASPFRAQEMTIARHLYEFYDLKVPPLEGEELSGPDAWAEGLLDRMSPDERAAWEAAYGPRNAAFRAADLAGEELVRWKYQRYIKDYLRCVRSVDDELGRLLDALEEAGLAEDTVVVYSSDQGFFLGEHGFYDKRWMYEPSLRLPLIVRWPGVAEPGSRRAELVQNLDLAPTFLEAAGVAVPAAMQGASLVPLLRDAAPADGWRPSIYYEYFEVGIHAVEPHYGVRTARHKLIHFPRTGEWELYDLEADPSELENLHGRPGVEGLAAELGAELARLRERYAVPAEGA